MPFLSDSSKPSPIRLPVPPVSLRERLIALAALAMASLAAILWSARHQAWLYYGDAEAHLHIARRLFDSHRPGLGQFGSVWLPLPHLVLAPFVAIDPWWRSGFAAVIPSALCYLAAALGLYLLARIWLAPLPSAFALAFFALNPNLLYLQTTAMSEPLFLAVLVWSVLLLVRWRAALDARPDGSRHLWPLMLVLFAAAWTRYDGWILGFGIWFWMALALQRRRALFQLRFVLASFALLAAPVLWMLYNAIYFGDWLDFLRGPYSAAAIEARTSGGAIPPHPGWHNPWVSGIFFWHCSTGDAFARGFLGAFLLLLALFGLTLLLRLGWMNQTRPGTHADDTTPHRAALVGTLLLWFPLPFYAYSVAWGSVPIFLPDWWPHSWYNTRYGMELLPAFAFTLGFALDWILRQPALRQPAPRQPDPDSPRVDRRAARRTTGAETAAHTQPALVGALACFVLANVGQMIAQRPLVYVEATRNFAARGTYTQTLATALARLHTLDPAALVLVDTSDFPTIIPRAGLTYRQTLNESDKQYFCAALAAPAASVGIVLAFDQDEVARAVRAHPENLRLVARFGAPGQPASALYVSMLSPLAHAVLSPASR